METGTADPETTRLVDQLRADAMGPGTPAPAAAPDIIFVTSESFFDVTRLPGLTFSQDPLPNFHRLSETCTNGPFLSNTYGGGTGHVEMEMFTGLTSSLLKEGIDGLPVVQLTGVGVEGGGGVSRLLQQPDGGGQVLIDRGVKGI